MAQDFEQFNFYGEHDFILRGRRRRLRGHGCSSGDNTSAGLPIRALCAGIQPGFPSKPIPQGMTMNKLLSLLTISLSLSVGAACAADAPAASAAKSAQQSKMATCNQDAGDKKGDERKAFMKECL